MTGAQNRLTLLTRELLAAWGETRQEWRDEKAREDAERARQQGEAPTP